MKEEVPKLRLCIVCGKLFEPQGYSDYVCTKCVEKLKDKWEKEKGNGDI